MRRTCCMRGFPFRRFVPMVCGFAVTRLTLVLRGFPTRWLVGYRSCTSWCSTRAAHSYFARCSGCLVRSRGTRWLEPRLTLDSRGVHPFRFAPLRRGVWDSGGSLERWAGFHWLGSFVPCEVFLASWLTRVCRGVLSNWFAPIARSFLRLYAWDARGSRGIPA